MEVLKTAYKKDLHTDSEYSAFTTLSGSVIISTSIITGVVTVVVTCQLLLSIL